MSLQNRFFNPGLFRNNLKRFKWGSFLYFVILLISGPIAILLERPNDYYFIYHHVPQFICAIFAVPVIACTVVCRYLHSRKQTDMFHSLPVTRTAMFVTNLLSIFTLVALPVVINGLITLFMTIAMNYNMGYVIVSTLWQLFICFVMISISLFCVIITGNSFAAIVVTYIVNLLPAGYILIIDSIFTQKLYGYSYISPGVENFMMHLPMIRFSTVLGIITGRDMASYVFSVWEIVMYGVIALILLFASCLIYKKRKSEAAGEVVGFNILNPVFKVILTLAAALLCYLILIATEGNTVLMIVTVLLVTFVVWFGLEMVITKSIRVFRKYKGFLAFCIVITAVCICVETGGLGFEKRIPNLEKIENVTCAFGYDSEDGATITDKEIIAEILKLHTSLVEDKEYYQNNEIPSYYQNEIFKLEYKLKNGTTIERNYRKMYYEREKEHFEKLFEFPEFKPCAYSVYNLEKEKVTHVQLNINYGDKIMDIDDFEGIYQAIIKDINALDYKELRLYDGNRLFRVTFYQHNSEQDYMHHLGAVEIRSGYKNTINWLKDNGYYEKINSALPGNITINESIPEEDMKILEDIDVPVSTARAITEKDREIARITDANDIAEIILMRNDGHFVMEEGRDKSGDYLILDSEYGTIGYCYRDTAPQVIQKYLTETE